jgi:DNA-directed RNA polymerase specialized sigma24 family protein
MVDVERLYRESADHLQRIVRNRFQRDSVPDGLIEDACAEAWAIAWRHRGRLEAENPIGWVIVVAVNEVLALLRKRRHERAEELAPETVAEAGNPDLALDFSELIGAVANLKPSQRTTLLLQAAGFSYAEIQQLTGQTYTWVNRHITEGRRAMRDATP